MNILQLNGLNKAFGGLQATLDVNLYVEKGERVSIIGPNGAGKTTLFNQISGHIVPDSGRVIYEGDDITGLSPYAIVRMGIGRAFQRSNVFSRLTAFENIHVAVISHRKQQFNMWRPAGSRADIQNRVDEILSVIGMSDRQRDRMAGKLSLGDQKRLEIGLALALDPRLLLLDEPTAGMSARETEATVQLVNDITRQLGISLLFTEHDMEVVFGISERIYVLNHGEIIAEGAPQAIADDPRVQEVYLGSEITEESSPS